MKTAMRASVVYANEASARTRNATRAAAAGVVFAGIAAGQVHILADPVATLANLAHFGEPHPSRNALPPTTAGK
jgi:alcohol dehydrogenase class IV